MLHDGSSVLAIIPARGGSKGIPRKNLIPLAGKPLINYTINAAIKAKLVDSVWVSSDDDEILKIASIAGAHTLNRPIELADDSASAVGVVHHFISCLPKDLKDQDALIVYLQPTSPLRDEKHIDAAIDAMQKLKSIGVVSVVVADKPPQKSFRIDEGGHLLSLFDEHLSNARRQDLPRCYYPNGAIYAFRISEFLSRQGFPSNGSLPFIMSDVDSIDIDSVADLACAEIALGEKYART
jgi:CMP-N,N'-diacetyllegionaminic acid synthase